MPPIRHVHPHIPIGRLPPPVRLRHVGVLHRHELKPILLKLAQQLGLDKISAIVGHRDRLNVHVLRSDRDVEKKGALALRAVEGADGVLVLGHFGAGGGRDVHGGGGVREGDDDDVAGDDAAFGEGDVGVVANRGNKVLERQGS